MPALAGYIIKITDCLYRPFTRFFSEQFFRYGVCGAANLLLDWILYFLTYNFVVGHKVVEINSKVIQIAISPHIMALCIVFPITLFTGFWLNKYVTFRQSELKSVSQFFRYITIVALNLTINYLGLKLLVDVCGIYPTPSKMIITIITVAVSYFGQKYFSFATAKTTKTI